MDVLMTASLPTTVLVSATTCICEKQEQGVIAAPTQSQQNVNIRIALYCCVGRVLSRVRLLSHPFKTTIEFFD